MSYQVKKTIEFNNSYEKPVNILKGAILEKDDGGRVIQIYFLLSLIAMKVYK